jgi:hypothetical protein
VQVDHVYSMGDESRISTRGTGPDRRFHMICKLTGNDEKQNNAKEHLDSNFDFFLIILLSFQALLHQYFSGCNAQFFFR